LVALSRGILNVWRKKWDVGNNFDRDKGKRNANISRSIEMYLSLKVIRKRRRVLNIKNIKNNFFENQMIISSPLLHRTKLMFTSRIQQIKINFIQRKHF
jgi:hypothetical protein